MKRLALLMTPILILALLVGATGCSKEKATPGPSPTATPPVRPTGELRIAFGNLFAENPDPVVANPQDKIYLSLMYDYLVGVIAEGELSTENGVAHKWEHSADYLTWTFYLREGIKFHNGDDLTAEDVKFSLEQLGAPWVTSAMAKMVSAKIKDVVADGPYKITVNLKNPAFFFDYELSPMRGNEGMITPKKYIEANGRDYFRNNPIGSGPYRFVKQQVGQDMTFEALDNHWALGVPKYKTVTYYKIPEEVTRVAALKNGQVDVIDVSRQMAPGLQKEGSNLFYSPIGDTILLWFHSHTGEKNPLSDKRVRLALLLAIDKQAILDNLFQGQGVLGSSSLAYPFTLGSVPVPPIPYDPQRAKALLAEAGYPDRFDPELTIHSYPLAGVSEGTAMLEAIASDWIKVGVKVKILPSDLATFSSVHRARKAVNAVTWFPAGPDKLRHINDPIYRSSPPGGAAYLTDPPDLGYDALLDELAAAKTSEQWIEVVKKISQYNYDNLRPDTTGILMVKRVYATNQKVKLWDPGLILYDVNIRGLVAR